MNFFKIKNYHFTLSFASIIFVIFYHQSFWLTLKQTTQNFKDQTLLLLSIGIFLWCFLACCFEILSTRKTYYYTLLFFCLLGAISAYYMDTYHISLNPMIIDSVLQTNLNEAKDFFHFHALLKIFTLLLPIIYLIFISQDNTSTIKIKIFFIFVYLLIMLGIFFYQGKQITFAFKAYKPTIDLLNPIAPIRSTFRYISATIQIPKTYTFIAQDAQLNQKELQKIIILIIGESARAKNLQYNGYPRPTNPYTQIYKDNLINFSNFSSCGVITAISIPCMLSHLTHKTYTTRNLSYYQDNILDIAKRVGYDVWWISNNGGECMGKVCQRLKHVSYYNNASNFDGDMLKQIKQLIQQARKNTFLVINLHGSHGARYFKRYPKEFLFFSPVCQNQNLQECSQQSLINAYDNSLRYTDYFIAQVISYLNTSKLNNLLWYISDHGESLGEYGQYMHGGLPYALSPKEQTHIPSLIYLGKGYQNYKNTLSTISSIPLNHDYLFHTLLNFLDIQTKDYQRSLDITQKLPNK